jgi:HPt (histidine-containing phosphotransfer) domain-containing protein
VNGLPQPALIDKAGGLANIGGDDALYRRMLGLFRDTEANFLQRFRAAHAAGDVSAATRAAHDLKSEAGTLGMHSLQEAAAALERACLERGRDADIDAMAGKVARQLDEILDEVVNELQAVDAARTYSPKDFR